MSYQSPSAGMSQQDRTLSDLLETYRHLQADPDVPQDLKARASERMTDVWAKLAKLQDPDGFINHLSEYIQREFQKRHNAEGNPNLERRAKPLCRCDRSRHVCEVKEGKVPSKIRTQDLEYIQKPDNRTLAREYVQEHTGDVVVREAMESFRNLRARIYSDLSDINSLLLGEEPQPPVDGEDAPEGESGEEPAPSATPGAGATDAPTAASDGGTTLDASAAVSAVSELMAAIDAFENGEVDISDLQAVRDGEKSVSEIGVEIEDAPGGESDE